jgi:hypothetical protein
MTTVLEVDRGVVFDGRPVRPTLAERVRGRWRGGASFTHWSVVRRARLGETRGTPRFVVRVDDYPRWDVGPERFARFHAILRDASIRYLLGVIPLPSDDPASSTGHVREWTDEERAALREAGDTVDVALHGLTHARREGPVPAEIVGRGPGDLARDVDEGLARLRAVGRETRTYIPPYNAVDHAGLRVLGARFDVVCGGPESTRWLGCLPGPCRLEGVWFVPSYPPAYGRATDVLRFVTAVRRRATPLLVPLTLHWAWEVSDRFESVRRLADALAASTVTLDQWQAGSGWRR